MNDGPESERLAKAVFYGTVLLVAWIMWRVVQPFAAEIGWAVVLAVCLNPIRMRVEPRFGRTKTALLLVLAVLVVVVVPMVFVGHTLYDSGESGVHYVQLRLSDEGGPMTLFHRFWEWLHGKFSFLPDEQAVVNELSQRLAQIVTFAARNGSTSSGGAASSTACPADSSRRPTSATTAATSGWTGRPHGDVVDSATRNRPGSAPTSSA